MNEYPQIYHIGCMKTGTTTLQQYLKRDTRFNLIVHSRFFNTSKWKSNHYPYFKPSVINIESDENICRKYNGMLGLKESLNRIKSVAPNAKIILTIREQRSVLISMYKHHVTMTDSHASFNSFLNSKAGISFLKTLNFYDVYSTINSFFNKNQIFIFLFEDMKENWDNFIHNLYSNVFLLSPPQNIAMEIKNKGMEENNIQFHRIINFLKIKPDNSFWGRVNTLAYKIIFFLYKKKLIPIKRVISWDQVKNKNKYESRFREQNSKLEENLNLNLEKYNYLV